ncbi:MAG: phosphoglycolate phosphatase, partial [Ottowia sp.]|nr:phosphoglycolate phosphatase [Ottowia sp.]MCB2070227.1 phosphoglycolate phosphatase [Ottowia sp.]MCP5258910.1 phosphoglycolate phosphatase [Burkholderiaceae bacterium]
MPAATPPTPLPAPAALMIDLDGTLVDTVGDFTVALNTMLAELGRQGVTREQVVRLVGKGSEHLLKSVLALEGWAQSAMDSEAIEALFPTAWAYYQRAYLAINGRHSALFPGVREGLAALAARGLPLACLTNKPQAFAVPLLEQLGIAHHFRHVFGGDSFARKKPDPLPLLETCRALGSAPARTWMVGDSSNDAQAARAAGCPVVLMTYGYNHGEPVQSAGADALLDALTGLPALIDAAGGRMAA